VQEKEVLPEGRKVPQAMNLRSRKLLCAGICFVTATVSLAFDKALFKEWADFTMWIFGIYAAGNVGEHVANGKKKA
tara:strand:+ start:257 stop:484 length:228 start_codon:yes stop_codon:yes gene_type:complete